MFTYKGLVPFCPKIVLAAITGEGLKQVNVTSTDDIDNLMGIKMVSWSEDFIYDVSYGTLLSFATTLGGIQFLYGGTSHVIKVRNKRYATWTNWITLSKQ